MELSLIKRSIFFSSIMFFAMNCATLFSSEFMEGTYKAMKSKQINDYLFATGKTVSLKKVVKEIFKSNNLNWKNYVGFNKKNFRKYDIKENYANINLTKKNLKWKPKYKIKEIIKKLNNTNIA